MLTNANITVFNKKNDSKTRSLIWNRTILHGVSAYINTRAVQQDNSGRIANEAVFRVPESCTEYNQYLREHDYITSENTESFWTFATGDLIVEGECYLDITGISTLLQNNITPLRICAISDNRRGLNPHIRVRCE